MQAVHLMPAVEEPMMVYGKQTTKPLIGSSTLSFAQHDLLCEGIMDIKRKRAPQGSPVNG